MTITLDEHGPDEPNSEKKGKKSVKAYQDPEELKTYKDTMREINQKIKDAYTAAYVQCTQRTAIIMIYSIKKKIIIISIITIIININIDHGNVNNNNLIKNAFEWTKLYLTKIMFGNKYNHYKENKPYKME